MCRLDDLLGKPSARICAWRIRIQRNRRYQPLKLQSLLDVSLLSMACAGLAGLKHGCEAKSRTTSQRQTVTTSLPKQASKNPGTLKIPVPNLSFFTFIAWAPALILRGLTDREPAASRANQYASSQLSSGPRFNNSPANHESLPDIRSFPGCRKRRDRRMRGFFMFPTHGRDARRLEVHRACQSALGFPRLRNLLICSGMASRMTVA
jgi:hypothetical protein